MSLQSVLRRALSGGRGAPPRARPGGGFPPLSQSLEENLALFEKYMGGSEDFKCHRFRFGKGLALSGALLFIDGMVNSDMIAQGVLKPLIASQNLTRKGSDLEDLQAIQHCVLYAGEITPHEKLSQLMNDILSGDTVLLLDGCAQGLAIGTKGWDKRSVSEPQTEAVVRGPREGFTENLRTNTSLLRRRLKSPRLRIEHRVIGEKTATVVCIVYLEGVAKDSVVQEMRARLDRAGTDSVLDVNYLEEYLEDSHLSVFPTVGYTEKPDVAAAKILEGRVAVLSDGSPFVLTAPALFIENFQTAEDYYVRPLFASLTRLMRFVAYMISVLALPIFLALTTFHQELIPTTLLITVAGAREGTPFPALIEALIMVLSFEILREAGLRLPRPIGQSVSIVGALVMGEAAVSAGLVGAPMVITVAITAVASFIIPSLIDTMGILRLGMMVLAATLGGFGVTLGILGLLVHLATLQSFGLPFFDGVVPSRNQQDTFVRLPLWMMMRRPVGLTGWDAVRRSGWMPSQDTEEEPHAEN